MSSWSPSSVSRNRPITVVVVVVAIGIIVTGIWIYRKSRTSTTSSPLSNVRTQPPSQPPAAMMVPGPPGPPGPVPQNLTRITLDCTNPSNTNCRVPVGKVGLLFNPPEQFTQVYINDIGDANNDIHLEAPDRVRIRVKDTNMVELGMNEGVAFTRRDGKKTIFDNPDGDNIIYGHTTVDDEVTFTNPVVTLRNGWTIDTSDGHFRLKQNGQQKFVMHQDGAGWKASSARGPDYSHPWLSFNWLCPSRGMCPYQEGYNWT